VALLLVASVNSTKRRRARRKQLGRLRRGLEHQAIAPKPDRARLLDEFFGPERTPRHLSGPGRPAEPWGEDREGLAADHQNSVAPQRIGHHVEPLYEQARSAAGPENDWDGLCRPAGGADGGGGASSPGEATRAPGAAWWRNR
jgi:hypothetical protein